MHGGGGCPSILGKAPGAQACQGVAGGEERASYPCHPCSAPGSVAQQRCLVSAVLGAGRGPVASASPETPSSASVGAV